MSIAMHEQTIIEPIIDSITPPTVVEAVLIGSGVSTGIRLVGFSGRLYPEREDVVEIDGQKHTRQWVRPVSVLDISSEAMKFLEEYILYSLSENEDELAQVLKTTPGLLENIRKFINKSGGAE